MRPPRYNPRVIYEWDEAKARANLQKHGVSFTEATTIFLDPLATTYGDPAHSRGEMRLLTFGHSAEGRILLLSHLEIADDHIRIISARRATKREIHGYQEER
jgi:uncharacterized DUF497 family protein